MGSILLRNKPSGTCNFNTALKSTFDFTEIERMEVEARNSVLLLCQIYFLIVIGATHTNFKMFSNELICSLASDHHENNEVKDFLDQNFRLGYLSDFRKLSGI